MLNNVFIYNGSHRIWNQKVKLIKNPIYFHYSREWIPLYGLNPWYELINYISMWLPFTTTADSNCVVFKTTQRAFCIIFKMTHQTTLTTSTHESCVAWITMLKCVLASFVTRLKFDANEAFCFVLKALLVTHHTTCVVYKTTKDKKSCVVYKQTTQGYHFLHRF